jgi:tetratricopeptide (TPR) repeat protein
MLRMIKSSRYLSGVTALGLTLAVAILGLTSPVMAQPVNVTPEEMALSPRFCPDVQGYGRSGTRDAPSAAAKRWVSLMGDTFWHVHHYCWGQINLQRALHSSTPQQTRQHLLGSVRNDYLYVVRNASKNFILLPEIYTKIGDVELLLSLPNDANKSFAQARALKPDYWPAYSHWAEFLINAGKKADAKQLVRTGLEYSPGARVLQEQYRLLGGKPSEIVPKTIAPPPKESTTEPATQQPDAEAAATDQPAEDAPGENAAK